MKFIIPSIISFILTVTLTPFIIKLAKSCKCLDTPGERRLHNTITPRWGGAAFFIGVLPFLCRENSNGSLTAYIIASCLLVAMGMVDDHTALSWKVKFAFMTIATSIVIFGGNIIVHHIGSFSFHQNVDLGWISIPFTFFSIIGITNAINLLDGLNGLAGGVSLLAFMFMGIAALLAGNLMVAIICFSFVGALTAFLIFNFPSAKIFMGDTGSLFLGFSLAIIAVILTQNEDASVNAMFPVLVLLLPIFDTVRVLLVRLTQGTNPFKADNLHLHYLLISNRTTPVYVTLLFWSLTAFFGCCALILTHDTSQSYLNIVLFVSALLGIYAFKLTERLQTHATGRLTVHQPDAIVPGSVTPPRYNNPAPIFVRRGGLIILKGMIALVTMLLAVQVLADF